MTTETLLFLVLIVLLLGALPSWPYSNAWGYTPTGILSVVLVVFLIWAITQDRSLFRQPSAEDLKVTVQNVGQDLKAAGRDAADSIRKAVE